MQNYVCDFDSLIKSNALLHKWSLYFGIKNCKFLNFAYTFQQKKSFYFKKIKTAEKRQEFLEDWDAMFFAKKIENDLIKQYRPAVFSVLRRFRIKNPNVWETAFDVGLAALRGSVWRYRMNSVKFLSYAMTGMVCAVRGAVFRFRELEELSTIKTISISRSETNDSVFAEGKSLVCKKVREPWETIEDGLVITEKNIAKLSGLSRDESCFLKLRLEGDGYKDKFKHYYTKKHGKPCTKHVMTRIWRHVRIKIMAKVEELRGPEVAALLRA